MVVKKGKRIVLVIVVLLLVTLACELVYERHTEAARKVDSIHVKLHNTTKTLYGKSEFDIASLSSMGKILSFIQEYQELQSTYEPKENETQSIEYEITVIYKSGNQRDYRIPKEAVQEKDPFQEVVDTEEVIKQTRCFYTVNKSKVKSVEICKWSQNVSNDMKKQQITNKETMDHLFEICKEYTVKDPEDSATFKQSAIYFYNKKGKVVATFYFNKNSKSYEELVKAVSEIANFV